MDGKNFIYFSLCIIHSLAGSGWSTEGVITEQVTVGQEQTTVQCASLHLTSFAVLVDVRGAKVQKQA